jgi:hypothetical protein
MPSAFAAIKASPKTKRNGGALAPPYFHSR